MIKVFIKKCPSYDEVQLREIFESIISNTPSLDSLKPHGTVLLKTNLLLRKSPEAAATTHPFFLRALARVLIRRGFKVIVGDSPGGLFNASFLKSVYDACGLLSVFKDTDVELNYNTAVAVMKNPHGSKPKEFAVTRYIREVDYIINVPKLKTHVAMTYTGAIKNWYGTIAGERKFDYHVVVNDTADFANMLIDIYLLNKPHLTIMDAVVGMDHNGPAAGKPKELKLVLASEDGFALDLTALKILGIDPDNVPVMKAASARNLLPDNDAVEIVGEALKDAAVAGFALPDTMQTPLSDRGQSRLLTKLIGAIRPKIAFNYKECKRCRECGNVCPAHAIEFHAGKPRVRHKRCIKCFCCHELCTADAVEIKQSPVLKSLLTLGLYNKSVQKSLDKMFGMIAKARHVNRIV